MPWSCKQAGFCDHKNEGERRSDVKKYTVPDLHLTEEEHQATLTFISLHIEDKTLDRDPFIPALMDALQKFADFNQCPQLDAKVVTNMHTI